LIIEYEAPGNLSTQSGTVKAKEQTVNYIKKEAEVEERYGSFLGVILCDKIAFVRYDVKNKDWVLRGPYDLNRETALRFIEAVRGLRRARRVGVQNVLEDDKFDVWFWNIWLIQISAGFCPKAKMVPPENVNQIVIEAFQLPLIKA
jgi:hypothetical protein